ncbi:hypothetical protein F4810DRAFT_715440 [Camillea tinctor]|nr:hypothetical protein F4810DRAFT_715440 [Camillea tinctor]
MKDTDQNAGSTYSKAATYINHSADQLLKKLLPTSYQNKHDIEDGSESLDSLPDEARGIVSPSIMSLDSVEEEGGQKEQNDTYKRNEETKATAQANTNNHSHISADVDEKEERRLNKRIDNLDNLFKPTLQPPKQPNHQGLQKKQPQNKPKALSGEK